jgi:hypothetical protein
MAVIQSVDEAAELSEKRLKYADVFKLMAMFDLKHF